MTTELEDLQQIGVFLKAARKELGLSQQRVSELAGISRIRYHDIEAGRSAPRVTTLICVARALKLELMFVPKAWVPAATALFRPNEIVDGQADGYGNITDDI